MPEEVKPVSTSRKVGSTVLLLLGAFFLYVLVLGTTAAVLRPDREGARFWLLTAVGLAIGLGVLGAGAALWQRWPMALGVFSLVLGAFTVRGSQLFRRWAVEAAAKSSAEAAWLARAASVFVVYAVLLGLVGVALIAYERGRRKGRRAAQTALGKLVRVQRSDTTKASLLFATPVGPQQVEGFKRAQPGWVFVVLHFEGDPLEHIPHTWLRYAGSYGRFAETYSYASKEGCVIAFEIPADAKDLVWHDGKKSFQLEPAVVEIVETTPAPSGPAKPESKAP